VLRSNVLLLGKLGASVWACAPPTSCARPRGLGVRVTHAIDEAVSDADVVMMLRIQLERMQGNFFPSLREYFNVFGLTPSGRAGQAGAIIMHPADEPGRRDRLGGGRRPYSVILDQVTNGVAVRMAVLYLLAGARRQIDDS